MLAADTMEALGIERGQYVIKVNNRKVLDGLMEAVGLGGEANAGRRLTVLRAIDKLDRLGIGGVQALLGKGRKDESGDFTPGANLDVAQSAKIVDYIVNGSAHVGGSPVPHLTQLFSRAPLASAGLEELAEIARLAQAAGYGRDRIRIDSSVVRGLEYYTGPVFEAELTFQVKNEDGHTVRFGSVGGGGRYDGLVERFIGEKVPATGFSMGVSRLQAALSALDKNTSPVGEGPVVVVVMDRAELPRYQHLAQTLRQAGIRAEMYLGTAGMKAQMRYADRRGSPCVVIQGGDEIARGEIQIKDLIEGAKAAQTIKDAKEWREGRPAQVSVPESELVAAVRAVLARHQV
jgi:histidyl-tRNA synthetase